MEYLLQVLWVLGIFYCWLLAEGVIRGWKLLLILVRFFLGIFGGFGSGNILVIGEREIDLGVDVLLVGGAEMPLNGVNVGNFGRIRRVCGNGCG